MMRMVTGAGAAVLVLVVSQAALAQTDLTIVSGKVECSNGCVLVGPTPTVIVNPAYSVNVVTNPGETLPLAWDGENWVDTLVVEESIATIGGSIQEKPVAAPEGGAVTLSEKAVKRIRDAAEKREKIALQVENLQLRLQLLAPELEKAAMALQKTIAEETPAGYQVVEKTPGTLELQKLPDQPKKSGS